MLQVNSKCNYILELNDRTMIGLVDSWQIELLVLLIGVFSLFYVFSKRRYTYWERKGFKSLPNPSWIVGHFWSTVTQQEQISAFLEKIYKTTTDPFIGIYSIFRPILLVQDPEIVRTILVKDFQYFTDRKQYFQFQFT